VWSCPSSHGIPVRATAQALIEVSAEAKHFAVVASVLPVLAGAGDDANRASAVFALVKMDADQPLDVATVGDYHS
jgi:hypothetical protein